MAESTHHLPTEWQRPSASTDGSVVPPAAIPVTARDYPDVNLTRRNQLPWSESAPGVIVKGIERPEKVPADSRRMGAPESALGG